MNSISTNPYNNDSNMHALVNAELMEKIFFKDTRLHARLQKLGKQQDTHTLKKVLEYLEGSKKKIKRPKSIPINKTIAYKPATCENLFQVYKDANVLIPEEDGMGTIVLGDDDIPAEIEVVKVIKILLELGTGKDEERVSAVRTRLQDIVGKGYANKMFTRKSALETLTFEGYYLECIDNQIKDILENGI